MQRRTNLAPLILVVVVVLGLTLLMVVVEAQARIAFESDRDWAVLKFEIYVMDNDGGNQRNLSNNPSDDRDPSWSPDGQRIAFSSDRKGRGGNRQIYVMDTDGGNQRNLSNNDFDDWDPSWSPDGQRIAFTSKREGLREIYVMNADGATLKTSLTIPFLTIHPHGLRTVNGLSLFPLGVGNQTST